MKKATRKSGPEPARLKIEGSWEGAVGVALKKPRPEKGWPDAKKLAKKKTKKPA
jgi:hypothetical protein